VIINRIQLNGGLVDTENPENHYIFGRIKIFRALGHNGQL
jgi:hypothetical protein